MFTAILYSNSDFTDPINKKCLLTIFNAYLRFFLNPSEHEPQMIAVLNKKNPEIFSCFEQLEIKGIKPGFHDMYSKLIYALQFRKYEKVFILEHDVFYPPNYFLDMDLNIEEITETYFYNKNVVTMNEKGFWYSERHLVSNLCANGGLLAETFMRRKNFLVSGGKIDWNEPGKCRNDKIRNLLWWTSKKSVIDVRHGSNLTGNRSAPNEKYLSEIPFWGEHKKLWSELKPKNN